MANDEDLEILRQGMKVWNQWRSSKRQSTPDLSGVDLRGLNLSAMDLSRANLHGVILRGTDLSSADLWGADLGSADLVNADLRYANLIDINLRGADLRGANLSCAELFGAHLRSMNLRGGDLSGAILNTADLRRADLRNAHLIDTDLRGADLTGADLTGAILHGVNLSYANLSETVLHGADFSGADLRYANLTFAHLSGADLRAANLSATTIGRTTFGNTDLSYVKGLETVDHREPSTIGIDTINLSKGNILKIFLRGCGLSDWQIEAAKLHRPDLTNDQLASILYSIYDLRAQQAIQISPLFISYTHKDGAFVDQLEVHLVNAGIRFWRDVHHATAGRLERQIDRAIRLNPTVLLVLSENSVNSDWVEHEARLARKLEKEFGRDVLCPIALDGSWKECGWPERLREQIQEYNILDFSNWRDTAHFDRMYRRLIDGLDLFYRKKSIGE